MNHWLTTFIMNRDNQTETLMVRSAGEPFPKPLRQAILAYAIAVRRILDLGELPSPDARTVYHYREYVYEMEGMLVSQLVSGVETQPEREAILRVAGLDHLCTLVAQAASTLGDKRFLRK